MKKVLKGVFVLLITITSMLFIPVYADAGWDSNYSSGSSGFDSGGYSSSNYDDYSSFWDSRDSDYDTYGSGTSSSTFARYKDKEGFIVVFCFLILIIFILEYYQKITKKRNMINHDDLVKKFFPSYTEERLLQTLKDRFFEIQDAWMEFDYKTLKKLCSEELFYTYKTDLEFLQAKNEKNIMSDYTVNYATIRDIKEENGIIIIDMYLRTAFYDYVINEKTEEIVRGNNYNKVHNMYVLTFIVSKKASDGICPNCGSKIKGDECPYCHTHIKMSSDDFLLSTKETID